VQRSAAKGKERRAPGRAYRLLVAPQGFEPRSSESESLVLPLNEGATGVSVRYLRSRDKALSAITFKSVTAGSGQVNDHGAKLRGMEPRPMIRCVYESSLDVRRRTTPAIPSAPVAISTKEPGSGVTCSSCPRISPAGKFTSWMLT
jgi:hypothetical protein